MTVLPEGPAQLREPRAQAGVRIGGAARREGGLDRAALESHPKRRRVQAHGRHGARASSHCRNASCGATSSSAGAAAGRHAAGASLGDRLIAISGVPWIAWSEHDGTSEKVRVANQQVAALGRQARWRCLDPGRRLQRAQLRPQRTGEFPEPGVDRRPPLSPGGRPTAMGVSTSRSSPKTPIPQRATLPRRQG